MLFRADVHTMLDALNIVTRALAARPPKEVLEGVLVEATDRGIQLTCSDGSLTIQSRIQGEIEEKGRALLPGRLFADLARKLPDGDMQVKLMDNHSAVITCQRSRSSLSGMDPMEYPRMSAMEEGSELRIPNRVLREMINRVAFAVATDETRQILTGILLEVASDEARLVALDGFRLAMQKTFMPFDMPEGESLIKAVIPGKVMTELSRILPDDDEFCHLQLSKGRMEASFGDTTLSTVLLAGEYIDYRRILPASFKTVCRVSRTELEHGIDLASLMAREGKNNLVKMDFREDSVTLRSNAESGDIHAEMSVELQGDPLEIAFNAKYLTDVIRNVSDEKLLMKFNTNVSPCVVVPPEGDSYLYLILPVRVFQ